MLAGTGFAAAGVEGFAAVTVVLGASGLGVLFIATGLVSGGFADVAVAVLFDLPGFNGLPDVGPVAGWAALLASSRALASASAFCRSASALRLFSSSAALKGRPGKKA